MLGAKTAVRRNE